MRLALLVGVLLPLGCGADPRAPAEVVAELLSAESTLISWRWNAAEAVLREHVAAHPESYSMATPLTVRVEGDPPPGHVLDRWQVVGIPVSGEGTENVVLISLGEAEDVEESIDVTVFYGAQSWGMSIDRGVLRYRDDGVFVVEGYTYSGQACFM